MFNIFRNTKKSPVKSPKRKSRLPDMKSTDKKITGPMKKVCKLCNQMNENGYCVLSTPPYKASSYKNEFIRYGNKNWKSLNDDGKWLWFVAEPAIYKNKVLRDVDDNFWVSVQNNDSWLWKKVPKLHKK